MAKPLRTDDPTPPNMQFTHFGVLNEGNQSKGSLFTSITLNIIIAIVVCIVGAAAKKTIDKRNKLTEISIAPLPKEIEPIKPKIIPKPLPPVPPRARLPTKRLPVMVVCGGKSPGGTAPVEIDTPMAPPVPLVPEAAWSTTGSP